MATEKPFIIQGSEKIEFANEAEAKAYRDAIPVGKESGETDDPVKIMAAALLLYWEKGTVPEETIEKIKSLI